jgi:hypothetical protein
MLTGLFFDSEQIAVSLFKYGAISRSNTARQQRENEESI